MDVVLRFTDAARAMILRYLREEPEPPAYVVRVAVETHERTVPQCSLALVEPEHVRDEDHRFDADGFRVVIDPNSARILENGQVDWIEVEGQAGFEVRSPHLVPIDRGSANPCGACPSAT